MTGSKSQDRHAGGQHGAAPEQDRLYAALLALTRQSLLDQTAGHLDQVRFARLVAEALGVRRASLWRLANDSRSIAREFIHDTEGPMEGEPASIGVDSAPAYFRALSQNQPLVAPDAMADPRTCELGPGYLAPLGISSILDTPIYIAGRLAGVLCLEHVGPARSWTATEQGFAVAAANLFALMIAQRARSRSEDRLRTILESEPECVKTVSVGGEIMSMNSAGLRMVEAATLDTVSGTPVTDLVHPDDQAAYMDLHQRVARGATGRLSFRIRGRKGRERWVHTSATPLREPDGSIESVLSVTRDVTEELAAQRSLQERVKELRCLYRVLELTTSDTRPSAEIADEIAALLPGSLRFPGLAVASVCIGKETHLSPGWVEPVLRVRRPVNMNREVFGFVELGYREVPEQLSSPSDWFLDEEIALADAVATHIGRMLADRRNTTLLHQAERLRGIGELTGGIAHDFNNLLQVILGTTDQLADALAGEESLQKLALLARSAAGRGADLTSRLLAFARQQPLAPRSLDAASLLEETRGLLQRAMGSQVALHLNTQTDLWPAFADPGQLESAVLNLGLNARDAMPDGGTLTIDLGNMTLEASQTTSPEIHPGDYVVISVSDTGTGMSPETLARAFDPFFTTKAAGRGSGLGLSMVYGFAKQSRGHVRIYSEAGHGTTVRLYLPRAAAAAAPAAIAAPTDALPGGSEHLLLVEDDDLVRTHVISQLETLGYRVTAAAGAGEALALLELGERYDLLFTDIIMPGPLNGQQLAERALDLYPDMPVLFTSGYTESTISSRGWLRPGVLLLSKPYRRRDLAFKLREALSCGKEQTRGD